MRTFSMGGIHPPENKISAGKAIEQMPLPKQVTILLNQHLGAPALPLVQRGDRVKTGQLIAKAAGYVSANIHSSVTGKVLKLDEVYDPGGYRRQAVVIEVEPDEWVEDIVLNPSLKRECTLSPEVIIQKIQEAGVVGMGGASFPTHVKLSPPPGNKAEVLIVNAVECEPYLTSDHQLMLEKGMEIIVGTKITMMALKVNQAVIAIENNKPDAINLLQRLAIPYSQIEVMPLEVHYPQGGEKQLIDAVLGRHVPSGALPVVTGAVVLNVGSVFATYEAVQKNKPVIDRVVCVTGKTVRKPGNYLCRIGTSIQELIDFAGGIADSTAKVISGGPMMGKALINTQVPVSKGTSGILLMDGKEALRNIVNNCIRCGNCIEACPMGLEPYLLMSLSELSDWENTEKNCIMDCIECGCCSYVCPSNRPLLDQLRVGKFKVGAIIRGRKNQ